MLTTCSPHLSNVTDGAKACQYRLYSVSKQFIAGIKLYNFVKHIQNILLNGEKCLIEKEIRR